MDRIASIIAGGLLMCVASGCASVEQAKYTVASRTGRFEIRDYPSSVVAEALVEGSLEGAGNKAFRSLFGYISGKNRAKDKIAMTAPVTQQQQPSEKIAMTTPVEQRHAEGGWIVSFVMPASYTMESLPVPESPDVTLRQVPERRMAAVRYSGFWSESRYLRNKQKLERWIAERGLTILGDAVWARYNPPITPWFLRRNEILIPIDRDEKPDAGSNASSEGEQ